MRKAISASIFAAVASSTAAARDAAVGGGLGGGGCAAGVLGAGLGVLGAELTSAGRAMDGSRVAPKLTATTGAAGPVRRWSNDPARARLLLQQLDRRLPMHGWLTLCAALLTDDGVAGSRAAPGRGDGAP